MPATLPDPSRRRAAVQGGLLAALTWIGVGWLELQQVVRLPFLLLLPLFALLGAFLATTRLRAVVDVSAGLFLAIVVMVGVTPLLRPGVQALIVDEPLSPGGADALVVLSAGLSQDGYLSPAGTERLLHGVELLERGAAPTIVTTRLRRPVGADTVTSDTDQARLIALAPDSVRHLVVDSVHSTRDEAMQVAALARREGWRQLVVVTSPMHTRRACAAFRHVRLHITCSAAPSRDVAVHTLRNAGERWRALSPWLHEVVGWWWYGVRGWR
ncbi:MAG: YdcF family protein [Gemmatimonadales bacterium]